MLNIKINYPYPVVREYADDYTETKFIGDLEVHLETDGYKVITDFEINNREIQDLIKNDKCTYALEVQCVSTWYRKLYQISQGATINLDPEMIHERVELTPCIVAKQEIKKFTNDDFVQEYQGIAYNLNVGDIIGIGQKRTFDALYENDIIKNGSSIVDIVGDNTIHEIKYDFSQSTIKILLPRQEYENYKICGYSKSKYKILNAVIVVPVLVEAIGIIAIDENNQDKPGDYQNCAWYKTIVVNLKRYAENKENEYRQLLEKPFLAVEILLGNNYVNALEYLSNIE